MIYGVRNIRWRRGAALSAATEESFSQSHLSPQNPPSILVISDEHAAAAKFATSVQLPRPPLVQRTALAAIVIS